MNRPYNTLKISASIIPIVLGHSLPLYANQICQTDNIELTNPTPKYLQHTKGTVTDSQTDLMWYVCSEACDTPTDYTWEEALNYVEEFNAQVKFAHYSDWRLPNIRELATLAELQCFHPAINMTVFPDTLPLHYWSSSPYKFYPHYSWYMNFKDGVYTYGDRTDKKHIRLVRDASSQHKYNNE